MSIVTNPAVTASCEICGQVIGGKNERGLRQGMGVHKQHAHGIKRKYARKAEVQPSRIPRTSEEVRARKRQYYQERKLRLAQAAEGHQNNGAAPASNAVPVKVHECCVCGSRHYAVKGNL